MKKKEYQKPQMEVIYIRRTNQLLAGSPTPQSMPVDEGTIVTVQW